MDAVTAPSRLDLLRAGVGALIRCTGFIADFSWIRLPFLDTLGRPLLKTGVAPVPGLYFIGFPWLRKRKSGLICGVEDDAPWYYIVQRIAPRRTRAS